MENFLILRYNDISLSSSNRKYQPFPLLSSFSVVMHLRWLYHHTRSVVSYMQGIHCSSVGSPHKGSLMQCCDVKFVVSLVKPLNNQSIGGSMEMPIPSCEVIFFLRTENYFIKYAFLARCEGDPRVTDGYLTKEPLMRKALIRDWSWLTDWSGLARKKFQYLIFHLIARSRTCETGC